MGQTIRSHCFDQIRGKEGFPSVVGLESDRPASNVRDVNSNDTIELSSRGGLRSSLWKNLPVMIPPRRVSGIIMLCDTQDA